MKIRFGDKSDDNNATRRAKIRALFTRGTTIEAHTEKCFRKGIWTESENAMAAMAQHREEVRSALREVIDGVPWAGETRNKRDGKPVWRQSALWEFDDYEYNINRRLAQSQADIDVINRMIERCRERYGKSPHDHLVIVEGA